MKWRDLTCQDADDFDALLNFACLASDFACGDKVALVPSGEEMVWQSPVDMCTLAMGADVAEKKLATVVHVETSAPMENVPSSGVRGRTTVYEERIAQRTRSKLKSRGESVGAALIGRRGRPQKTVKHNQT